MLNNLGVAGIHGFQNFSESMSVDHCGRPSQPMLKSGQKNLRKLLASPMRLYASFKQSANEVLLSISPLAIAADLKF